MLGTQFATLVVLFYWKRIVKVRFQGRIIVIVYYSKLDKAIC